MIFVEGMGFVQRCKSVSAYDLSSGGPKCIETAYICDSCIFELGTEFCADFFECGAKPVPVAQEQVLPSVNLLMAKRGQIMPRFLGQ